MATTIWTGYVLLGLLFQNVQKKIRVSFDKKILNPIFEESKNNEEKGKRVHTQGELFIGENKNWRSPEENEAKKPRRLWSAGARHRCA